jgi:hypothetical protein
MSIKLQKDATMSWRRMPIRYLHDALAPFYTAQNDIDDHEHDGAADKPSAHRCGLGHIMRQRDSEKLKQDGSCAESVREF